MSKIDFNQYQSKAQSTFVEGAPDSTITRLALGLNGEAGEVAEKVKKVLRDKKGVYGLEDTKAIADELGDVLWYLSLLAKECGYDLEEIAQMNVDKLASRKERGKIRGSGDNR